MSFFTGLFGKLATPQVTRPEARPEKPFPKKTEDTLKLVEALTLAGPALVMDNGTFVRGLEVWPVDLEAGNRGRKQAYHFAFGQALRRLRAPSAWQIVITSRPQDIGPYLERLAEAEGRWREKGFATEDMDTAARRFRLSELALEHRSYLEQLSTRLQPLQQRYLLLVAFNPFAEMVSRKPRARVLDPRQTARAEEVLEEELRLARGILAEVGLPYQELSGVDLCQALWAHYHPQPSLASSGLGTVEALAAGLPTPTPDDPPTADDIRAAAEDPLELADLLAPKLVEEQAEFVRLGDVVGRGYFLTDFDSRQPVDLAAILAFDGDVTHSLYLQAADPVGVRQRYREKETELSASADLHRRRGIVEDFANEAAIGALRQMRRDMEVALQAPFNLYWYALVWAPTLPDLERQSRLFETTLKLHDIRFQRATRRHLGVVQSTRPVFRMAHRVRPRMMSAGSLGSFLPFVRKEYMDPAGWDFGVHRGNGLLVCRETFQGGSGNASQLIIASPRAGKSVYMKSTIVKAGVLGDRCFIFDPEREYLRLACRLHAPYIELAASTTPIRLPIDPDAGAEGLLAGIELMARQYESLTDEPASPAQICALADAVQAALADQGIREDDPATWTRTPPAIGDVLAHLEPNGDVEVFELRRVLGYVDSAGGRAHLNIMDPAFEAEHPWRSAVESLGAFVEAILGRALESGEFTALVEAYQDTMARWGVTPEDRDTWRRERMPLLGDLAKTLLEAPSPEARQLARAIREYAVGIYADLFNHRTSVDLSREPIVFFGLRSLREEDGKASRGEGRGSLAGVVMWLLLRAVWNEIVANAGSRQKTHVFIDELKWVLSFKGAARRLETMCRSFPKYSAALYLATQDMKSLLASAESDVIANITQIKVFLKQENASVVRQLGEMFDLSDEEQQDLLRVRKGEGLLVLGDHERIPIFNAVNPAQLAVYQSNAEQQQAVAVALNRRLEPVA